MFGGSGDLAVRFGRSRRACEFRWRSVVLRAQGAELDGSERVSDIFAAYVEEGWFGKCSRRLCLMSRDAPSFFVEHDFWTDEEIEREAVAMSGSRRTESLWVKTRVYRPGEDRLLATMLLNQALIKDGYHAYASERAQLYID